MISPTSPRWTPSGCEGDEHTCQDRISIGGGCNAYLDHDVGLFGRHFGDDVWMGEEERE